MDRAAANSAPQTRTGGLFAPLAIAGCTVTFLYTMIVALWSDPTNAGTRWKQGDWLINSLNEPIRRGPLGSGLITIADMLGVSPFTLTLVLQLLLLGLLLGLTALIFRRLVQRDRAYLLLLASPGFYLIFWAADPQGSLRKELLVFCAMGLVLTYPLLRSRGAILVACLLFVLGAVGHELNVLLFPAFATVMAIIGMATPSRKLFALGILVTGIGSIAALGYAVTFSRVADIATVCAPLLERGLSTEICKGAIGWLDKGSDTATAMALDKITSVRLVGLLAIGYIAALLPIGYFVTRLARPVPAIMVLALTVLPVIPLYAVSIDWGRWINLHVTSAVFILAALGLTGRLALVKSVSGIRITILILAGVLLTPNHETGLVIGGVAHRVAILTSWLLAG